MAINREVVLRNGVRMPILGLGTTHNGGYNHETVLYAIQECGVRLIDTAKRYGTERYLGQAVLESGVPREDLFLTTKLWPSEYGGGAKTRSAFQGSCNRLESDYIDLYMLHWPDCASDVVDKRQCLEDTWRELELLLEADKCRAIGVSNFLQPHLESLLETASVVPHVNQVEFHPYQNPKGLRQYCAEQQIQFEGYCPLAKGLILKEAPVVKIAAELGVTPAQLLLRWSVQNGVVTIPKSTHKHRVKENSEVLSDRFQIPPEKMAELGELHSGLKASWNPETVQT